MKIRYTILSIALIGILFSAAGCDDYTPESTQAIEVTAQLVSGRNLRLMSITSTEYKLDKKQSEVRSQLEAAVNSGKYNIASVSTSYSSGYLAAAEVTYDVSGPGEGNEMRVMFIYNNSYPWAKRAANIKPRLDGVINGGEYDIVKINTVYAGDSLLAAEVYYREK